MKLMNIADEGMRYKSQLYELYEMAFPEQGEKPLHVMEQLVEDGKMEMLAIVDGDEFVGLAINMLSGNCALLDYYAIIPENEAEVMEVKVWKFCLYILKIRNIFFEIEIQDEQADNAQERKRRKAFYLRNGLKETGLFANVYDTDFEILHPMENLHFRNMWIS